MQWYNHFKLAVHISNDPYDFETLVNQAPDAKAARMVYTTYTAAALHNLLTTPGMQGLTLEKDLEMVFGLSPRHLLTLSIGEMAELAEIDQNYMAFELDRAGFKFDQDGIYIIGFEGQKPLKQPKIKGPRP